MIRQSQQPSRIVWALAALSLVSGGAFASQTAPTVGLTSSANPVMYGQTLTLTATVSPANASGAVTFYDGISVLGVANVHNGIAALKTTVLPCGMQRLRAFYSGDATYQTGFSPAMSQAVSVTPGNGFQNAVNYQVLSSPSFIARGDFNGDGQSDLAVANANTSSISILLCNGDGTFRGAVNYTVGSSLMGATGTGPVAIGVGDFNGDGNLDLAVANANTANVVILLGNGNGTFQLGHAYSVAGTPASLSVADFNQDGRVDLVLASPQTVSVLLGNGDGTFQSPTTISVLGGDYAVVGDFNGDGIADLAVADNDPSGRTLLSVLIGNGDGTFQAPTLTNIGFHDVQFIAVADFNRDGNADLVITDVDFNNNGNVGVLLGKGDGTFLAPVNSLAGGVPQSITIGDINADGIPDLVVSNGTTSVSTLIGNGDGTFGAPVPYSVGGNAGYSVAGDFNGDGRMDLAVANASSASVSVLLGGVPDLSITLSHFGSFGQSLSGFIAISVQNVGMLPTTGTVTVADTIPPALTLYSLVGTGWTCTASSFTCSRSDSLAPGSSYPAISALVKVSSTAPSLLNNSANVTGGGSLAEPDNSATDIITIGAQTPQIITSALPAGTVGVAYSQELGAIAGNPPYDWSVSSGTLPTGLAITPDGTISGTPASAGTWTFTVALADVYGNSASQMISLTINPGAPVAIPPGAISNSASFATNPNGSGAPVAPGSLVSVFGTFSGAQPATAASVPFPTLLGGVTVTFNGVQAPLSLVVPGGTYPFINAQIPNEVLPAGQSSGSASMVVTVFGVSSAPQTVQVIPAAPGIFTIPPNGQGNAVMVFVDPVDNVTKIAAPVNLAFGYPTAPIPRGQHAFFYATGLGTLTPSVLDGSGGLDGATHAAAATPQVLVDGIPAEVDYAGQAPGYPGVDQINIVIPAKASVGTAIIVQVVTADGSVSSNLATIATR